MAELKLKKADIVLAVMFVIFAAAILAWSVMYFTDSGTSVTVTVRGEELGEYSLSENAVVVIKDGEIAGEISGDELLGRLETTDMGNTDDARAMKKVIGEYLDELLADEQYAGDVNVAVVSGGKVYMDRAGCDNQHCVQHQKISRGNEQIVCLPNKVILQIKDTGDSEVDIIAH